MSPSIGYNGLQTHDALADACKIAWHTFYGMQKASEDFENLRFEVWTVAISLDALHSVGSTSLLIDRQPDNKHWTSTFSKILNSLNAALRPLYNLVKLYLSTSTKDRAPVKNWLTNHDVNYEGITVQDFRRKLSMLVETLNVFLSSLTHAELARARAATETEEYRVLTEVTRTVVQKWNDGRAVSGVECAGTGTRSIKVAGLADDGLRENVASPPESVFSRSSPNVPQSPSWPTHQASPTQPNGNFAEKTLNLDGIETGFRRHMHAMRRIREQLRHQKGNKDHLSTQKSSHFPEPLQSPTAALSRTNHDVIQTSEDSAGQFTDTSSTGSDSLPNSQNGSSSSVASEHAPRSPSMPTNPMHVRSFSGEAGRKRVRSREDLQPECSNEYLTGSGTDRKPRKTALEQLLSAALFFDS
ncbi:hypothetical protein H2200_001531 [Cladophialophora chaetospira]|uniref:Uncharacterized protein n=1 Tax=Cladophialophora chaetospira TaxID=386627 RepID=A0AA38XL46_9EURO|nr:hypothetical protein H2200_001531 [Cladophialophora chaetospira]